MTLHIDVRREENKDDKDKTGYRSEVRYGDHSRSISLPRGVSQDGILATYTDGVIEIRIQLPEQFPAPARRCTSPAPEAKAPTSLRRHRRTTSPDPERFVHIGCPSTGAAGCLECPRGQCPGSAYLGDFPLTALTSHRR